MEKRLHELLYSQNKSMKTKYMKTFSKYIGGNIRYLDYSKMEKTEYRFYMLTDNILSFGLLEISSYYINRLQNFVSNS